jgi:malate dehydrogenase (oxaloacetate-decarboxylating)(NADP+)
MVKNDRNIFAACMLHGGHGDALITGITRNYTVSLENITEELFGQIQGVDVAPTDRVKAAVNDVQVQASALTKRWQEIVAQDVPALDGELQAAGLPSLSLTDSSG